MGYPTDEDFERARSEGSPPGAKRAATAQQDQRAINDATAELARARSKFSRFNSAHEGYAVLLEEVDELWELVRLRRENRATYEEIVKQLSEMRIEAIQIAAMALRFAADVCPREPSSVDDL